MNHLHNRIIEISKKYGLSHIGSCLTAVDIIDEIYKGKGLDERFILSCGHAGLALYVVLEKYGIGTAEKYLESCGVHPCINLGIDCSTGSLGQGLPIALGMAMADRSRNVYCLISDGEAAEGTIWEVANTMRKYSVSNLKVYCNWNGWGAYDETSPIVKGNLRAIMPSITIIETSVEDYGFTGQEAHYKTIKNESNGIIG